jgi:hypothetical protein
MTLSDPPIAERKSQSYPDRSLVLGTRFTTDRLASQVLHRLHVRFFVSEPLPATIPN